MYTRHLFSYGGLRAWARACFVFLEVEQQTKPLHRTTNKLNRCTGLNFSGCRFEVCMLNQTGHFISQQVFLSMWATECTLFPLFPQSTPIPSTFFFPPSSLLSSDLFKKTAGQAVTVPCRYFCMLIIYLVLPAPN